MMKVFFPGGHKLINLIPVFVIGICAFSLALPIRANAILTVAFSGIFLLYSFFKGIIDKGPLQSPLLVLIAASFSMQAFGLVHSPDIRPGFSDIERFSFALIFPIIFFIAKNLEATVKQIITLFAAGCIGICLYGFAYTFLVLDATAREIVVQNGHTYFTDIISIHPTYLGIYLIFIFFFLLETARLRFKNLSMLSRSLLSVGLIALIAMLLFLRSQMQLIIFALLIVLYLIIILKRRAWLVTFLLFAFALMIFLLDKSRVTTFFDTYGKNVSTALDDRFKIWAGAVEAIKNAPMFGVGTGGEQIALNEAYVKIGYQEGIEKSFNAHNQYLEFWVRNGIFELGIFMALLIYSFRQSLKSSNYTFLMFNMIFSLSMLTESCLNVHRGIVFFYFFLSAFIFLPFESTKEDQAEGKLL
jgi:O-antigen ligase